MASNSKPRYDYYQTDTSVNVSVFVRGLTTSDVDVHFGQHSLSMKITPSSQSLEIQLFDDIDSSNSSFTVLNSKVDLLLRKAKPGQKWASLEASTDPNVPSYESAAAAPSTTTTRSQRPKSKWDNLKLDEDDEDGSQKANNSTSSQSKPTGQGASIDSFFQQLYADADDDTRRAMMKSYQESGGTSLSTNWSEVSKGKVEAQPPGGMEAKKW
ncbi:unnamed protein product [Sympodiomycopsis kandeliae]